MTKNGNLDITVLNYSKNVSTKSVKIIQSYTIVID